MTIFTKTLLAASLIGFILGGVIDFSNLTTNPTWTVAMPLGAVFFGLFLISYMLQKEMAEFDREEALKLQLVAHETPEPAPRQKTSDSTAKVRLKEKTI
jgi:hypothetical protein